MAKFGLGSVLLLLITWTTARETQCAADGSPQLRFVARLSVSGCALFVHDTGANDGPHLAVEPLMCVTESLHKVAPRYDPVTQQTYVSVPVTLRDDAMLAEVQRQLRHLSPKSVKFATVSDINASTDASSKFQALGFDRTPEEPTGILRLGCRNESLTSAACCAHLVLAVRDSKFDALDALMFSVAMETSDGEILQRMIMLKVRHQQLFHISISTMSDLPKCQQLRFVRSVHLRNCTARVHKRLDMKGHFLIEPLLCYNITSMSNESVMNDYSRDMYYLKLDVVLQDDMAAVAVRTQLADLSPRSVTFMRLWRAQSHVASVLSHRFVIGPLMVSGDWRSAQLRVYCRSHDECSNLGRSVTADPFSLWKHVKWTLTSALDAKCATVSPMSRSAFPVRPSLSPGREVQPRWSASCRIIRLAMQLENCHFASLPDGRTFLLVQQQLTGSESFQRNWADYEVGFGSDSDFWIGLSTIHSLSKNGVTLRVEMKLWNGTGLHVEYAGFRVGDASTEYTMTYRRMLRDRSSLSYDALEPSRGMKFSTMDVDNDLVSDASCSSDWGNAGWWFNGCMSGHPNGVLAVAAVDLETHVLWHSGGSQVLYLREVCLMLEV